MDEERRRIAALVSTLGLTDTVDQARASLRPVPGASLATDELPELSLGREQSLSEASSQRRPQLLLRGTLGEGGMGVVHLAMQTTLSREVAVKSARPGPHVKSAGQALVHEGVITGQLEHPNVVPVHALGRDADGVPLLVMKRVEGTPWRELLRDPAHPAWEGRQGAADQLEWHLGVLMQVAQATHFAHCRGYVHRDLKPDNVMIGRFGEVYVLDWGLAVQVSDVTPAAAGLVGTPAYMAPEMVVTTGHPIGPRTDVYLLGAILHEILAGEPPHRGTLGEALLSAARALPPGLAPTVPREIAAVCARALRRDPGDRFATADELRQAVASFLKHRSSVELAERASARARDLERLLATDSADAVAIYRLFGECRFGFQESLRAAPDNATAREGLESCVRRLALHEVARRNPDAAAAAVAELQEPPPELLDRIAALRREIREEASELETLRAAERERDPGIGSRARAVAAVTAGLVLCGGVLVWFSTRRRGFELSLMDGVRISLAVVVGLLLAGLPIRRQVLANQASRRIALALLVAAAAVLGHRLLGLLLVPPVPSLLADDLYILAVTAAMGTVTLDRRLIYATVWLLGSAVVLALHPERALPLFIVGNLGGLIGAALAWSSYESSQHER